MSSVIAPIVRISEVFPHPNADRLEIVKIGGWQVVVGKGSVAPGDAVLYVAPDTIVDTAWSDRWGVTPYLSKGRVRSVKLRGEPSFGFIARLDCDEMPLLREAGLVSDDGGVIESENAAEIFGLKKFMPEVSPFAGNARAEDPRLARFTSIENLRHYGSGFTDGEAVVVTEKVHGCLKYNTNISMADGSARRIMNIEIGDEVLGMNEDGTVVATRVTNKFNNGKAEKWLKITGNRRKAGRGSSFYAVHATPNHRFWVADKRQYVAAEDLKRGDELLILRSERGLTPVQEQVILGKMLGDGSLCRTEMTASVAFGHKVEHEEYVDWTLRALGDLGTSSKQYAVSGYGTRMARGKSSFSAHILNGFEEFVGDDGVKCVPSWVPDRLGPIAMAFWYMDDGSLNHHEDQEDRVSFATNGFSKDDCIRLTFALQKFDINATIYESSGYRIRLGSDDSEKFFLLIAPYVPTVMQYKLPLRYRGHEGWLPKGDMPYKPLLVRVTVGDVFDDDWSVNSARWDIETGTHNFFANGILVHNSNSRIALIEGEYMAASKRVQRDRDITEADDIQFSTNRHDTYWFPFSVPNVSDLLDDLGKKYKQVILFGEIYGPSIQKGFDYSVEPGGLGYVAFDLMLDGKYLDAEQFDELRAYYEIPGAPVLYEGPYDAEKIKRLTKGRSLIGGSHIREGVVVRSATEQHHPKFGRKILKLVSDEFLTGNNEDLQESA